MACLPVRLNPWYRFRQLKCFAGCCLEFFKNLFIAIILIIWLLVSFSLIVFYWSLNDSKSPQISYLLSTLDVCAVVGMFLILPLISTSTSACSRFAEIVTRVPAIFNVTVPFMFTEPKTAKSSRWQDLKKTTCKLTQDLFFKTEFW